MTKWLEINLGSIRENIKIIKKKISWPKVKLMPVVKANAYGHGIIEVAKVLENEKVDFLAVATFNEAVRLRKNSIKTPILIIGYIDQDEIERAIKNGITLSVYDLEIANKIIMIAKKINKIVNIHLKLDSGMHRLGILPQDFIGVYKKLVNEKFLKIDYFYTHFADVKDIGFRNKQLKILNNILKEIKKSGLPELKVHISRSESLGINETYYDMVRPGLAIYGLSELHGLKPALSFKTKIGQVKNIKKGDFVGYCLTYRAKKDMKIATIAVGYADGFGRNLSNVGEVLIKGIKCLVIGRVCMNLTIVDISCLDKVEMGDEVILIGKDGKNQITAKDLAEKISTIPYEIVSRIPAEIPRIYKK